MALKSWSLSTATFRSEYQNGEQKVKEKKRKEKKREKQEVKEINDSSRQWWK